MQTTQIGPQADSGSGQDMETKAPTPDNASVATTLIENPETAIAPSAYSIQSDERIIIEDTEIFIGPPYVDKSTGRRMIELLYFTPTGLHYDGVGLDDCEFIGCESIEPKSDDDEIEALFRYDGYKFWAYVPFGYVKARAKTNSAVSTGLTWVGLFLDFCKAVSWRKMVG